MRGTKPYTPERLCPEESFLSLVLSESKRSERSGHPCRILLVYRTNPQGSIIPFGVGLADKAIPVLARSCRDTDFIGWYRHGRVVGVLLTTLQRDSVVDGSKTLDTRLVDRFCGVLAFTEANSLRVQVLDPDELTTFNASDHSPSSPLS